MNMLCVESSVAMVMGYFMQLYGIDMDRNKYTTTNEIEATRCIVGTRHADIECCIFWRLQE